MFQPKSFRQLQKAILTQEIHELLRNGQARNQEDTLLYNAYNQINSDKKQLILQSQIKSQKTRYNIDSSALLPNPFSYTSTLTHLPFCKHFVLWVNSDLETPQIVLELQKWCNVIFPNNFYQFCFFENKTGNRSIPEIKHYHVFINLKPFDLWLNTTSQTMATAQAYLLELCTNFKPTLKVIQSKLQNLWQSVVEEWQLIKQLNQSKQRLNERSEKSDLQVLESLEKLQIKPQDQPSNLNLGETI